MEGVRGKRQGHVGGGHLREHLYARPSSSDPPTWSSLCHSEALPPLAPSVPIVHQAKRVAPR